MGLTLTMRGALRRTAILAAALSLAGCAGIENIVETESAVGTPIPPRPSIEISAGPPQGAPSSAVETPDATPHPAARSARIFRGAGVTRSLSGRKSGRATSREGDVTLNFADADVAEAASLILGDILGRNYVVSPEVSGKVTFETTRPLAREAVADAFDLVLSTVGATLVDRGDVVEILPLTQARSSGAPIAAPGRMQPGFRVEIAPLQYVDAVEMRQVIEPIGGEGSVLAVDPARNVILLAGTSRTLQPLRETIALFDQNWASKMSLGLVPLENVSATNAIKELKAIFSGDEGAPGLAIRYVPIERMNAVVLIAPEARLIEEMVAWLEELDQQPLVADERVYVYFAQNTRAAELAASIQATLGGGSRSAAPRAEAEAFTPVSSELEPLPGADPNADEIQTAPSAATTRFGGADAGGVGFAGVDPSTVSVVAEEQRNAILVSASPQDWRKIRSLLRQLDVQPLQVLLEATVVEVTLNDTLRYGLQWFFSSGNNSITLSDAATGAVNPAFPGFSYVFAENDIQVALDALTQITDLEIVSAPSVMVVNNETATLQVGDQVPIATQSSVSVNDPDAPIVNTIQYRDTGVILKVTPRVNNSGLVIADIDQEVSLVSATESSGIDSPTISTRRLTSTVAVSDGQSITLGGLMQDRREVGRSGLPVLSEVPVLGSLFRSNDKSVARTELLLVLTPRVVRDGAEARSVSEELRRKLSVIRDQRAEERKP